MSTNLATVTPLIPAQAANDQLEQWRLFLAGKIDPAWRPTEWNAQAWLFTGDSDNPSTVVYRCRIANCGTLLRVQNSRCKPCELAFAASGMSDEQFDASYRRGPMRYHAYNPPGQCIAGSGSRCQRRAQSLGICRSHYSLWQKVRERDADTALTAWVGTVPSYDALPSCLVAGCEHETHTHSGLCPVHY
ncbi:hypothetical protein [Kitasatospora sp. NPDC088779]|uniref:hypothetical protein n=1 Tax=Kitasatospora sp. NPDC088779 TaxID=3154964 RepID=UPI003434E060